MFRLFLRMGGWLAVLPLLVVVVAAFSSAESGTNAERLRAEGLEARATITGKYKEKRFIPRVRNSEPDYVLQFSYSSGSILRGDFSAGAGKARVSREFFESLGEGDTTPLRYLSDDDTVFEIEPGSVSGEASNAMMAAAIVVLFCLPLFLLVWRRAAQAARLREAGARSHAGRTASARSGQANRCVSSLMRRSPRAPSGQRMSAKEAAWLKSLPIAGFSEIAAIARLGRDPAGSTESLIRAMFSY